MGLPGTYQLKYGHAQKDDKPDTDELTRLAAAGHTRTEMAQALGLPYKRFSYLLNKYHSLNQAYAKGVKEYKEHHAKK